MSDDAKACIVALAVVALCIGFALGFQQAVP